MMAKKKTDNLNKHKLDLSKTLNALDHKDFSFYNNLNEEEKKAYAPLILMRFLSSAPNQDGFHEYFLESVNEVVNKDFWLLSKDKEFQHLLLSACGYGKKFYHQWIAGVKTQNTNKLYQFFAKIHPNINNLEFEILMKQVSIEELSELCKEYALDPKEGSELIKQLENSRK